MQLQENPARVLLELHGNCTEGFLLRNIYCLECGFITRRCGGVKLRDLTFTTVLLIWVSDHITGYRYQTDRQIFYWQKRKVITDLFVIKMKEIYVHVYTRLLKSYDNIHGMTYTTKIMLSGIAKIKTGYFDNINDHITLHANIRFSDHITFHAIKADTTFWLCKAKR